MTRKRFKKLLMAGGIQRDFAEYVARAVPIFSGASYEVLIKLIGINCDEDNLWQEEASSILKVMFRVARRHGHVYRGKNLMNDG